jgi:hypothetical protein
VKTFYLGVHRAHWLASAGVPLFVSHRILAERRGLPVAAAPWGLDSGGFTEISLYGKWLTTPEEYVTAMRRYASEVGQLALISPQDWMCEPPMLKRTGLTVADHHRLTVENYLTLKMLEPDLPIIPALQGWLPDDYERCIELYDRMGVDLAAEPLVGVGTVCRRQSTAAGRAVIAAIAPYGFRLHGYGIKQAGILSYGEDLEQSDSMAWSYRARMAARDRAKLGLAGSVDHCLKMNCANCLHFALEWRSKLMTKLDMARAA